MNAPEHRVPDRSAPRRPVRRHLVTWLAIVFGLIGPAIAPARSTALDSAHATPTRLGPATWSDEFQGAKLDRTKWSFRATGPRHDGNLTPDAVSVADGLLTIKTYTEAGRHYSGMISTAAQDAIGFEQTYGYFEARVKFNDAPGEWSAFWLQSRDIGNPVGDPATAGVEMDVAEHRARCVREGALAPSPCATGAVVSDRIQSGLIWDGYSNGRSTVSLTDVLAGLGNDSWHTFGLRWTPTDLTFYYDDTPIWSMPGPISQHSEYIVLSSEVGAFFAGALPAGGYGSRETTTTSMQVDYVRVWDLAHSTTAANAGSTAGPINTGAPVVSGTPAVDRTLTCSPGSWTNGAVPTLGYQWLADGSPVADASGATYVARRKDRGHTLACRVTASNAAGATGALSNALLVPNASQRVRRTVVARISCAAPVCLATAIRATASGVVRIARFGRMRAHTYRPTATATTSANGTTVTIKLRLSRSLRVSIARALRARKRIVARLDARIVDSAGSTGNVSRHVPLRL